VSLRRPVVLAAACTLGAALALSAQADIALISIHPTVARVGQLVEVRAGAYKTLPRMPLYLVAKAHVPRPRRCGPNGATVGLCGPVLRAPLRPPRFRFLGRLDFRHHPRDVRLRFRVPRVRPGLYELVIYCDLCYRGRGGSLIADASRSLRVRRIARAPSGP
jgi:hypothetical protein